MAWDAEGHLRMVLSVGRGAVNFHGDPHPDSVDRVTERAVAPLVRLTIATVNGEEPAGAAAAALEAAGFTDNGAGQWVRRPRPIGMR